MSCSKMSFPTKADALVEIKFIQAHQIRFGKKYQRDKSGKALKAYQCPRCGTWHLTTAKQKRKY